MSSSSSYEPEEDEEASDSDFESGDPNTNSHPRSAERIPSDSNQNATTRASRSRAKRRTRETAFWDLRQQLNRESVSAYTALLAETAGDNAPSTAAEVDGGDNYNITQNGIVIWTPKEKETLFNVLDKKGKNGIKEIAETIGTKSELEVQEHLRLLHRGLERQHIRDRHTRTVVLGDIPAASEVGDECGEVLDQYADLVSLEEQYAENVAGRKKYHDAWIIDQEKAEAIDEDIEEEEDGGEEEEAEAEGEAEVEREKDNSIPTNSTVHLTARLLHMEKWIRLSERFFMNFGGPRLEDNWTKIAYPDESPSLTADAFADFYALTVSVTRRLVQSSLFFAMSRLRKMRHTGHRKAQVIKSRDVRSALDVLNMKRDSSDYWVGLARRCNLDVVDSRHLKGWKAVSVSHNEAEDILSGVTSDNTTPNENLGPKNAANGESSDDDDSVLSEVRSFPEPQLYLSLEDEHAEAVDQKTSNLEEQKLWERLGHPLPASFEPYIKPEDEDAQLRRPPGERKTKEDLVDWRDRTLYRSEWEEYENEIYDVYEEISENRRKRRRVAREEPVRVASPASTVSEVEEDVEMDTSDEQQEDIDLSTVKHEGDIEKEDDQDAEAIVSAGEGTETEDRKPIISSQVQGMEWNDSNPTRDTDDDSEPEEYKPPR